MKKLVFIINIFFFLYQYSYGQATPLPPLPSGWEKIYIKDIGSLYLPPTMEIQKNKYKEFANEVRNIMGYDATQLTAQQKGLNNLSNDGLEKYARVMVETVFGSSGDFEKLNFNITEYTQTDISELNLVFKEQLEQNFIGTRLKLIDWYPLKLKRLNGMSCIHISYKRQLQNEPYVLVHMYYFQNNDRMHILTLSYRLSEAEFWRSDYATILKSFRITNMK